MFISMHLGRQSQRACFLFSFAIAVVNPARIDKRRDSFDEAIGIAALGLCVNVICAFLLEDDPHRHSHGALNRDTFIITTSICAPRTFMRIKLSLPLPFPTRNVLVAFCPWEESLVIASRVAETVECSH